MVYTINSSPKELDEIRAWVRWSVDVNIEDVQTKGSLAQVRRGELCDWIHTAGGHRCLRPLSANEREVALGFPALSSFTGAPEPIAGDIAFDRLAASGNTFCPAVIAHLMAPFAAWILSGCTSKFVVIKGGPTATSREEALVLLRPSEN